MGVKDKTTTQSPSKSPENKHIIEESKQINESDLDLSLNSSEEEKYEESFEIYEQIDCQDKDFHWLNAEITALKCQEIRVHYTGHPSSKDEWISRSSHRLQKQWVKGRNFQLNNRIDVFCEELWKEGLVMEILKHQIKVVVLELKKPMILLFDKNSDNIAEIGSYSNSFGSGKRSKKFSSKDVFIQKEKQFLISLSQKNLRIKEVSGDGNCLFRAISDQIYGDEKYYRAIRRICLEYIEIEEDFFKNFVVQGTSHEKFKEYIGRKKEDGVWGDDVEIQALSEIYNKAVEIYAYSDIPMRTFHEKAGGHTNSVISVNTPIRLSYHGKSHFNSIIHKNEGNYTNNEIFGRLEEIALKKALSRKDRKKDPEEEKELFLARSEFENKGNRDLETALQESIKCFEETLKNISVKTFEQEETERLLIQKTMEESIMNNNNNMMTIEGLHNTAINKVLNEGFPMDMVLQAFSIVGDDSELMIKFIYENLT